MATSQQDNLLYHNNQFIHCQKKSTSWKIRASIRTRILGRKIPIIIGIISTTTLYNLRLYKVVIP